MKSLIVKIISVLSTLGFVFLLGSKAGKKKERIKQLKNQHNELQKNVKINKKVDNLSFSDKSNLLLSKQRNNKHK